MVERKMGRNRYNFSGAMAGVHSSCGKGRNSGPASRDSFADLMRDTSLRRNNVQHTENGARGYATTGRALLDASFKLGSCRTLPVPELEKTFAKALAEDKILAAKFLFYARDARGGAGERQYFRDMIRLYAKTHIPDAVKLIPLIPEYGRYDDLFWLFGISDGLDKELYAFIGATLLKDIDDARAGRPITLLAKWMPSFGAKSPMGNAVALMLIRELFDDNWRLYKRTLSFLRGYLDVVERKMSMSEWQKINYSAVPSRANILYNGAFLRHDEARRREYLASVAEGREKINASVLFPHEIAHKLAPNIGWNLSHRTVFDTEHLEMCEALWKALPNTGTLPNTLVVQDGSGSMTASIGRSSNGPKALHVSTALAIYFAERCVGGFRNKYVTFSRNPEIIDISLAKSFESKLRMALANSDCSNTNLYGVFELVLMTAIAHGMTQADLPETILVISDMEFDGRSFGWGSRSLMQEIADKYAEHGFKLPRLAFWNVCSRTGTIPMLENESGVVLVSGFSPSVIKAVMSGKTDPYEALLETLNSDRYKAVEDVLT